VAIGGAELTRLEGRNTQPRPGQAMLGLLANELARKTDRPFGIAFRRLDKEGRFDDRGIVRRGFQGIAVELNRRRRIIVAARDASRDVAAEARAGIAIAGRLRRAR
jgi:hypothetical protein